MSLYLQKKALKNFFSFFQIVLGVLLLIWMFSWEKKDLQNPLDFSVEENAVLRNQGEEEIPIEERIFQGDKDVIISLANQARRESGLPELVKNEKLSRSAQAKALDMKNKNYFQHVSPDGTQPWFFAEQENYRYKSFGENLAEGFFSAQETHEAWMKSEGHRKNILSPDFKEIGVGLIDFQQNGMRSYLIVQHFGTQLSTEELVSQIVCKKETKKSCQDAEKKMKEIKETIKDQKKIISDARDEGATKDDLKEAENNLDKLEEIKKELKEYLDQCEKFIIECDRWEQNKD